MKFAFLADPLDTFKTYKDTTYAMMAEAGRRGHEVYAFQQKDMALEDGVVSAAIARVTLTGDEDAWYKTHAPAVMKLGEFDAVLVRKDPPFDMEYVYLTYLLELAEAQGARIVNRPEAIRSHNEKLAIAQFPQFTSPTLVTSDTEKVRAFHALHKDVILKPLDGMGGAGIFRVKQDGMNLGSIIETLTDNGSRTIMAQRFIPEIDKGDKRILLIGGQVVPFCLARIPQNGEVRGNLAAGGLGVAQPISARDREIGEALGPVLSGRGLLLVGLDVIGDYLTEVNVTSPTCFQEIKQQTGFDVAGMFIDALEKAA
ncbi:glutathione synthase [Noviherbaspirillum sp.]|uniref:glutathione synthase n=1 Tax=Noviherbaspirillum sp. TaxID=1926288 RepID=UPI002FE134E5